MFVDQGNLKAAVSATLPLAGVEPGLLRGQSLCASARLDQGQSHCFSERYFDITPSL
jgi:hypothetical protein